MNRTEQFSDEVYERIAAVVPAGTTIRTLGRGESNHIVEITRSGIRVDTRKSRLDGKEPVVPAWMVEVAWDRLRQRGRLTNTELLNDLKVMRSAFVCALLARFPDVLIASTSPITLELIQA